MRTWLEEVRRALDEARAPVPFFFRDDDVGWGGSRLWEVLDLFAEHALPVDLAVIPRELTGRLARDLLARARSAPRRLGLHQHGFAHANHEPSGRKYEFGPSRPADQQRRDIVEGRQRLDDLLGPSVDPVFTPPWNRCTYDTARCLVELGFAVLSREARAEPFAVPGLVELPIRIDWFAHRKHVRLRPTELGGLVAAAVRAGGPVGVMFHHAIMDSDERTAAGELLALVAGHQTAPAEPMCALAGTARP